MRKAVRLILLLGGLALAASLIAKHAGALGQALRQVGWGFAWYVAASFLVHALDTLGWRYAFVVGQPAVPFRRLFNVRLAGEAVNRVTPLASLGGEPVKGYLLLRDGARLGDALASVAIAKNVMTLSQIAFIFAAMALAVTLAPGHGSLVASLGVFPAIVLIAMGVTAILDVRLRRRSGSPNPDEGATPRRALGRATLELWARFADYFRTNPRAFAGSFGMFSLGWAAGALELLAGAHALHAPLTVPQALALEGLLSSVTMATFFIPSSVGSQEGGFAYLAPLFGLSTPHGIALAVLRRCREMIWIAVGLIYLALVEGRVTGPFQFARNASAQPAASEPRDLVSSPTHPTV